MDTRRPAVSSLKLKQQASPTPLFPSERGVAELDGGGVGGEGGGGGELVKEALSCSRMAAIVRVSVVLGSSQPPVFPGMMEGWWCGGGGGVYF